MEKFITVVAGLVRKGEKVLVASRGAGEAEAGKWEFPGGKVKTGETPPEALVRELKEELGISVKVGAPVTFAWREQEKLLLLLFKAKIVAGAPEGLEGQECKWVEVSTLEKEDLCQADRELVTIWFK